MYYFFTKKIVLKIIANDLNKEISELFSVKRIIEKYIFIN